jgi:hypothetical protein
VGSSPPLDSRRFLVLLGLMRRIRGSKAVKVRGRVRMIDDE